MPATVSWFGIRELELRLALAPERALLALAGALYAEGHDLLAAALPITPIEYGPLRASGQVSEPDVSAFEAEVQVGFGGPAAAYAIYVHEDLAAQHNPPTQAKFLEQPALQRAPQLGVRLAGHLAVRLRL